MMSKRATLYKSLLAILPMILILSCISEITNDNSGSGDQYVTVNFSSLEPMDVEQPELTVSIYGYDPLLEDTPATLIVRENFEATEVPFTLKIPIPENPSAKIEGLRDEEEAKYYLSLEWDSDGNGMVCEGDINIDYDTQVPNLNMETIEEQKIYLTYIPDSTICE